MKRKDWYSRKYCKYVAAMFFIIAYILTIPIRGYEFLEGLFDISQGVPLEAHLFIIFIGATFVMALYWLIEIFINRFLHER